jgi:hypothetical protein
MGQVKRDELETLFDTDVDGLCENRWSYSDRNDRLSDADRVALIEFAANYR